MDDFQFFPFELHLKRDFCIDQIEEIRLTDLFATITIRNFKFNRCLHLKIRDPQVSVTDFAKKA